VATRNAASFARRSARFAPQPTVLILCEDSKASIAYLNDASRHFRASTSIRIVHEGRTDPLGIVQEALKQRSDWDEVHCVIDRNGHESFDAALQLAASQERVVVTPSYPCFEFWLLLHFVYTRSPFSAVGARSACDRATAELRLQPGMSHYDKGNLQGLFDRLLQEGRLPTALKNARSAAADAEKVAEPNPSTHMHRLIERIEALGRLAPL
jgi:RloB-like protein